MSERANERTSERTNERRRTNEWSGLDFPMSRHLDREGFAVKKLRTKMQNRWLFFDLPVTIFIHGSPKEPDKKKRKQDEQTLAELNSAHRCSQLVQTSYIKWIKLFLFAPCNKHLINRVRNLVGLCGRILTSVVCTRLRSRFLRTDLLLGW